MAGECLDIELEPVLDKGSRASQPLAKAHRPRIRKYRIRQHPHRDCVLDLRILVENELCRVHFLLDLFAVVDELGWERHLLARARFSSTSCVFQ